MFRSAAALVPACLVLACSTSYVEGRYSCTPGLAGECPAGWFCHAADSRCWSEPEDGRDESTGPDADADADADGDDDSFEVEPEVDENGDGEVPVECEAGPCDDLEPCNGVEVCGPDGECVAGAALADYTVCVGAAGTAGECLAGVCDFTLQEVAIAAGTFQQGSAYLGPGYPEVPLHETTLTGAYRIDRFEVTNARYAACVDAGECRAPGAHDSHTYTRYDSDAAYARFPVLNVSWDDATAFCAWLGRRLPTEAEWELAARGDCTTVDPATCDLEDARSWPWGADLPTCELANFNDATGGSCVTGGDTSAVGDRPGGASPYGVEELAGNAAEWVADWYSETYYADACPTGCTDPTGPATGTERTIRGGSWNDTTYDVTTAHRAGQTPGTRNDQTGFRCARPGTP
jgi:formylglycine-generating enzyme required for sulfatase activity